MDQSLPVRLVERIGKRDGDRQELAHRQRAAQQPLGERLALEQLHDQEVNAVLGADVVERADVRVLEARDRSGFSRQPLAPLGVLVEVLGQHLDRDLAVESGIAGAVDLAHTPGPEEPHDLVGSEPTAGLLCHSVARF